MMSIFYQHFPIPCYKFCFCVNIDRLNSCFLISLVFKMIRWRLWVDLRFCSHLYCKIIIRSFENLVPGSLWRPSKWPLGFLLYSGRFISFQCRGNFDATKDEAETLMNKMLEVRMLRVTICLMCLPNYFNISGLFLDFLCSLLTRNVVQVLRI